MIATQRIAAGHRVSGFYFFVFLSVGSVLPYFALWLRDIGMGDQQIGIIVAAPSFVMVLTTIFIGQMADRASDWRSAIVLCNWVVVGLVATLLLVDSFFAVLILWTLSGLVLMAMFPILDAAAIRFARHNNIEFHKMRSYGSVGFIAGVLIAGALFDRSGIETFVVLLLLLAVGRAVLSHGLPQFRDGMKAPGFQADTMVKVAAEPTSAAAQPGDSVSSEFENAYCTPWFVLVLVASALIHGSHAYYYTFSAVLWTEAGYSNTLVSLLWALGVVVEVILMWKFSVLARKATARVLLIIAAGVAIFRWWVFGLTPSLPLLIGVQMLHGVTFAIMFLATVNFIANWTPIEIAAKAQSLSATLNTSCLACSTLISGYLLQSTAERGYWVMALPCCVAILCIMVSFRLAPTRKSRVPESSN